jgi:hypothetical protein
MMFKFVHSEDFGESFSIVTRSAGTTCQNRKYESRSYAIARLKCIGSVNEVEIQICEPESVQTRFDGGSTRSDQ